MLLGETAGTIAISVFGVALLSCNPYVMDFFALARGYGMGLGLMMLSLFMMWRYISQRRPWDFTWSYVSATAAVCANLTYVAFTIALTMAVLAIIVFPLIKKPHRQIHAMIPLSIAGCIIFLGVFFYKPVMILSSKGEFEYGSQTLWESWKGFAKDSLYGRHWIGEETVLVVSIISAILVLAAILSIWIPAREDDDKRVVRFGRLLSVMCIVLIAFFIANHVVMGSDYPSGRKSIIYYPVFAMMTYFATIRYTIPKKLRLQVVCTVAGVMLMFHYIKTYSGHSYREWWYDSSTRKMVYAVAANADDESNVKLAVEWLFHPSTHFYVSTKKLHVDLEPYNKDILSDTPADFYYLHPDKATVLEQSFEHIQTFEGRWLMKRKFAPGHAPR
jgi:hypothetical protein